MNGNTGGSNFYNLVQEKLKSLSNKERIAAEYMAEHQDQIIYTSITELAELVGSSEATITRVCSNLGYPGFQALKVSVAQKLVSPENKVHEDLQQDASTETVVEKVFSSAIETLRMTQQATDITAVKRSVDALSSANRIVIIGNGNSGAIAMDAQHKFLRLGLDAHAYTDDHMQMIAVSCLGEKDVVLVISHSGSSRDAADAIRLASARGASTISITSNGISPVSKLADIRLYTYSQETLYRTYAIASRMAELTIIDTLYTGVALRLGNQAIESFEALEKALTVKKY